MAVNTAAYQQIKEQLDRKNVTLVAVSKTKPIEDIMALYELGHRDFGENYVQELVDKQAQLPKDIRWHFIGHLQRNKVKFLAPFVHLVHGVDSYKLLQEINKQAARNDRQIEVLLQMHIAREETKFGLDEGELKTLIADLADEPLRHIFIKGLMGMASFTDNKEQVRKEFQHLHGLFKKFSSLQTSNIHFQILSMGMSGDFETAVEEGSNLVRIGSLLFGERNYAQR